MIGSAALAKLSDSSDRKWLRQGVSVPSAGKAVLQVQWCQGELITKRKGVWRLIKNSSRSPSKDGILAFAKGLLSKSGDCPWAGSKEEFQGVDGPFSISLVCDGLGRLSLLVYVSSEVVGTDPGSWMWLIGWRPSGGFDPWFLSQGEVLEGRSTSLLWREFRTAG